MTEQGEGVTQAGGSSGPGTRTSSSSSSDQVLQIGFFFDGTLNNLYNAGGSGEGSYANDQSNVARLYRLYANDPTREGSTRVVRRGVYIEGIGTRRGQGDDMVDAALGIGNTGVSARVYEACRRLERETRHEQYREVIVDAFGFSRGAAAARYFVNCLSRRSFEPVDTGLAVMSDEPTHLSRVRLPSVTMRFLGVFDTVAAIGSPEDGGDVSDARNADVNVHLDDSSAQVIVHLTASNEYRRNFALNSIRTRSGAVPAGGTEIALPGAHSDVGGGYRGQGETVQPVQPAAIYTAHRSEAEAERNALNQRYSEFTEWAQREHFAGTTPPEFHRGYDDLRDAGPDELPGIRHSYFGNVVWVRSTIRAGLDRIALRLMHDHACNNHVPLSALPSDSQYAIPRGIQYIYDILHRGGTLSQADLALLGMNYIHWSAHYGAVSGASRSAFRSPPRVSVDIYPHAPAPNFRRIVHANVPSRAF